MKFGGASVASVEQFAHIAEIICSRSKEMDVVVVVSAMGGATDQLFSMARQVHPTPPLRELDMLVSVGERVSIALLAMALHLKDKDAISFTGSQSGIITTTAHSEARIIDVKPFRIVRELEKGKVVIVAGFQGVSQVGEITTLGRGGSDTTAVALAVALGASHVEFYKDVEGIYSEDPKKNFEAVKYSALSFNEALSIAEGGAKVLHARSISLAQKNSLPLHVLSFSDPGCKRGLGTMIGQKEPVSISTQKLYEVEQPPS